VAVLARRGAIEAAAAVRFEFLAGGDLAGGGMDCPRVSGDARQNAAIKSARNADEIRNVQKNLRQAIELQM
jgi:hypothetical protein